MSHIQDLLDKEANLSNLGHNGEFRKIIHEEIKSLRGNDPPACWGWDDCSTNILMQCPWRIDCGEQDEKSN